MSCQALLRKNFRSQTKEHGWCFGNYRSEQKTLPTYSKKKKKNRTYKYIALHPFALHLQLKWRLQTTNATCLFSQAKDAEIAHRVNTNDIKRNKRRLASTDDQYFNDSTTQLNINTPKKKKKKTMYTFQCVLPLPEFECINLYFVGMCSKLILLIFYHNCNIIFFFVFFSSTRKNIWTKISSRGFDKKRTNATPSYFIQFSDHQLHQIYRWYFGIEIQCNVKNNDFIANIRSFLINEVVGKCSATVTMQHHFSHSIIRMNRYLTFNENHLSAIFRNVINKYSIKLSSMEIETAQNFKIQLWINYCHTHNLQAVPFIAIWLTFDGCYDNSHQSFKIRTNVAMFWSAKHLFI